MPQGKLKIKAKLPKSVEAKMKAKKGPAISKRGNAVKKPKKVEAQKLKKIISKSVNTAAEEEIRALAMDSKKTTLAKKVKTAAPKTPSKSKRGRKK